MMNDVDFSVSKVLDGIDAAAAAGLPVKVNAVVKRGLNDDGIVDDGPLLPREGAHAPLHRVHGRRRDERLAARRRRPGGRADRTDLARSCRSSRPRPNYRGEVAQRWRYVDGSGEIGVIASVTQPFCGDCTRARISAEGRLYTCLFGLRGHDLRATIRAGASDEQLQDALSAIWGKRTDRYSERRSEATIGLPKVEMSYIGG